MGLGGCSPLFCTFCTALDPRIVLAQSSFFSSLQSLAPEGQLKRKNFSLLPTTTKNTLQVLSHQGDILMLAQNADQAMSSFEHMSSGTQAVLLQALCSIVVHVMQHPFHSRSIYSPGSLFCKISSRWLWILTPGYVVPNTFLHVLSIFVSHVPFTFPLLRAGARPDDVCIQVVMSPVINFLGPLRYALIAP